LNPSGFQLPGSLLGLHTTKFVPEFGVGIAFQGSRLLQNAFLGLV
jgi:hypothetical protein